MKMSRSSAHSYQNTTFMGGFYRGKMVFSYSKDYVHTYGIFVEQKKNTKIHTT